VTYTELTENPRDHQRKPTADVMLKLSRLATIAPRRKVVDEELAPELNRRFGRPAFPVKVPKMADALQTAFSQLARNHPALTAIDRDLMGAFERLMLGLPQTSDGKLSVTGICAEAGVSRASYYRSPVAAVIKQILDAPQTRRPEPDELREEVTRLKKTERELRSAHIAEVRELRATIAVYANQIQALALANAELCEHAHEPGRNIIPLPRRPPAALPDGQQPALAGPADSSSC
jgi:hypothetical protein